VPKFADVGKVINTSLTTLNHQAVLLALKTCKLAAGWQVKCSSDGITFSATGDVITHSGTGAGGFSNNGAWYVIEEPGPGRRQWCVQSSTASAMYARFKYSALAKFTGGSPGPLRVPSATDEKFVLGAGTDAAPTYAQFISTGGTYRYHVIALSHPVSGAYGFYVFFTVAGSAAQGYGLLFSEPMLPGTYSTADGDPVVHVCGNIQTPGALGMGWLAFGSAGQVWATNITPSNIALNGSFGGDLGNAGDINIRPWWTSNQAGAQRVKGCSGVLANRGCAGRTYPATMNRTTDSVVYVGADWVFPYPDNVDPSIA
jgi:hypothetical protein